MAAIREIFVERAAVISIGAIIAIATAKWRSALDIPTRL
jgi:hypothetical protein